MTCFPDPNDGEYYQALFDFSWLVEGDQTSITLKSGLNDTEFVAADVEIFCYYALEDAGFYALKAEMRRMEIMRDLVARGAMAEPLL